ncbi:MAG TPA: hypothetical protein VGF25_00030 [Thermoleophilaceae bacterium]|jgi:hypothetical protein
MFNDDAPDVTVRISVPSDSDAEAIRRLASLQGSAPPDGPVAIADVDGEPVAALGLADGDAVADPRRAGRHVMTLLHLHRIEFRVLASIWGF